MPIDKIEKAAIAFGHKLLKILLNRYNLPLSHLAGCRFFEMLHKTKQKEKN
jgi:hypothetical protein